MSRVKLPRMRVRSTIYKSLRMWNDLDAICKGKIVSRIGRRVVGKLVGRHILRKMR